MTRLRRVGIGVGYGPEVDIRQMVHWVAEAERRECEIAFFSETINLVRDAITALASFAISTQRIRLGATQVVRLRSPVVMAQTMASLDELSEGRMVFALGACTRSHALRHSLSPGDPVVSLREYFDAIRRLLAGEEVSYDGEFVKLRGVRISFRPFRMNMPLWLAATSRTGLRLAGTIADGVLLNTIASPEYSANAVGEVREGAAQAGRTLDRFEVAQIVVASVSDDREEALDAVRWEVASKFTPVQAPFNVMPRLRVGEPCIREADVPRFEQAYRSGGMEALTRALPKSYLTGLTACGTPREVRDRIEDYANAGVELVIIRPATSGMVTRLLSLFSRA